ncbi:hypothetical protein I6A60_00520 [Frankia sp. AgB1.9]|uniref:hypothetical protein n=1 Tax=unclassified Frankia TaxID=2632575 RepID=UPI001933B8D1|nr:MULTISPECIES: hypothetical protein [unclassified Frankia]MBL7487364.1 hypothetical protein [Frankia sp. AgW1.1]MBL7546372.1 hypothetical protein [Frankia sp. AgB1.9]MBL7618583.1 hypothetical protein [Frankia sp. AgB1.8]
MFVHNRPFAIDGVNPVRTPVDVLAGGAWSRAVGAAGGDPASLPQRAAAYQAALVERVSTVPTAIGAGPDGVLTFTADTPFVDLVAENGAVVGGLVPLTPFYQSEDPTEKA